MWFFPFGHTPFLSLNDKSHECEQGRTKEVVVNSSIRTWSVSWDMSSVTVKAIK
jgi:hypothetical protein